MFIEMGSITNATLANIAQYVGKIVSIRTSTMSIARAKFATAADPLAVEIVKADGTPFSPAITRTIPLASIVAMWEYGVEEAPAYSQPGLPYTGPQGAVQASAIPPWVLPVGAVALGLLLIWQSGFLASLGIGGKKSGRRKSRKSRNRRSKR